MQFKTQFQCLLIFTLFSSELLICSVSPAQTQQKKEDEPLIPETCTLRVHMKWVDNPYQWTTIVHVRNNIVTASPGGGTFKGTLNGNIIKGKGTNGPSNWATETVTLYPDGTASLEGDYYGTQKDGTVNHSHGTGRGSWQITSLPEIQPNPTTQTPVTETLPPNTIGPNEELKSIGQFEGQEGWIATPINPNAEEMTLPNMKTYINRLMDRHKLAKEMYQDAKAKLKQLQDEESNLRISISAWESEEKNIDTAAISEKIKTHHGEIKEIDQQFDEDIQQAVVDQHAPDFDKTKPFSQLKIKKKVQRDIRKNAKRIGTEDQKAEQEFKDAGKEMTENASQFMEIQDEHDANKAFAEKQILKLNDELKRHKELNRKIDEGKARLDKLPFLIETTKEKINNYAAVYQQGKEQLRWAYEQYKALEKKSANQ